MSTYRNPICIFGKYMKNNLPLMLAPLNYPLSNPQITRNINKHWNPKFKKERREKVIKIELPDFDKNRHGDVTEEEMRTRMKEMGLFPQKPMEEKPIYLSCSPNIFESYVAPEGDGKFSNLSKEGVKQKFEFLEKKGKSYMAIKKIKSFDGEFAVGTFPGRALEIYIKAHEALAAKDQDALMQYVTETAHGLMVDNLMDKTVRWKFLQSLEPARVVHARQTYLLKKENIYGQVTVRFHTQQILSVYDRFGRLMQGSDILRKDVLEYVVFENHLANEYGKWRIHGKIIPKWMSSKEVGGKTYIKPKSTEEEELTPSTQPDSEYVSETVSPESLGDKNVKGTTAEVR